MEKNEISIEGKSGTAILIDSFKCYHSGGHCKSKPRILLRILYSTIDNLSLPRIDIMNKTTGSFLNANTSKQGGSQSNQGGGSHNTNGPTSFGMFNGGNAISRKFVFQEQIC